MSGGKQLGLLQNASDLRLQLRNRKQTQHCQSRLETSSGWQASMDACSAEPSPSAKCTGSSVSAAVKTLIEHSLAENTLKHTFKLQPSTFQHLPHCEVQMYKPHAGSFTFNTYWKPHLQPILQEEHGVQSFEEYTQREQQQEQDKETKRQDRKDLLQEWCRQHSIDLSEADRHSSIYRRNCHLAVPLKRKAYEQLLPRITEEINQSCAQAAANLKRQKLPDRVFRLLEPSSSNAIPEPSIKPQQHWTSSGKPGKAAHRSFAKKDLTCSICGGSRLFTTQGLEDHTKAKHS